MWGNPTVSITEYVNISMGKVQSGQDCDDFDEDKYVKMHMSLYGIDNVRGSPVEVRLDSFG